MMSRWSSMPNVLLASMFGWCLAVSRPAAGAGLPVTDVEINAERLSLGDLVRELPEPLATLDLGPAPQPGQSRMVSRTVVLRRLRQAMVEVEGIDLPALSRVRRSSQTVTETELRRLVAAAVAEKLPGGMRVREVLLSGGVVLPAGALTVEVQPSRVWQAGRQIVRVELSTRQAAPRRLAVTIDLEGSPKPRGVGIARGAEVQILARSPGLVVRTTGVAQQGGELGDVIAVLPNASPKLIKARVKDTHTVEVEL
jgi:hypothetical protein